MGPLTARVVECLVYYGVRLGGGLVDRASVGTWASPLGVSRRCERPPAPACAGRWLTAPTGLCGDFSTMGPSFASRPACREGASGTGWVRTAAISRRTLIASPTTAPPPSKDTSGVMPKSRRSMLVVAVNPTGAAIRVLREPIQVNV